MLGPNNTFQVKTQLGVGTKFSFIIYTNMQEIKSSLNEQESFLSLDIEENSENASLESNFINQEIFSENYKFLHINDDLESKNANLGN